MKIIHLIESLNVGGGARVVEGLALLFLRQGIPTTILGFKGSDDFAAYLREQGLECLLIESRSDRLTYLRELEDKSTAFILHRGGERSPIWDEVIDTLASNGHHRIVERNIFGYVDTGPAARRIHKICFNSMHTLSRAWHASGKPPIADYLARHRVLYNPVLLELSREEVLQRRQAARQSYGLPQGAFVIGDICRPAPEKLDAMLAAVAGALARKIPNLRVLTRSFPDSMASSLSKRLGDRYMNLPVTNDKKEALDTLCAMDAFVHMSTMGESFGMAIAEAMRCGIPVICNETPGARCNNAQGELIDHGVSGFFANDPHTLVKHICALAESHDLKRALGNAARRKFRDGALAPEHIINDLLFELFGATTGANIEQAPSTEELMDYLRNYDHGFRVPPSNEGTFSPLSVSVAMQRIGWRLTRKCFSH